MLMKLTPGWLRERYGTDPVDVYAKTISLLLLALVVQVWLYIYIPLMWNLCIKNLNGTKDIAAGKTSSDCLNERFHETQSCILGTGVN